MLAKLELRSADEHSQQVDRAFVLKWHKGAGDHIEFGDDLVDIWVERLLITVADHNVLSDLKRVDAHPSSISEMAAEELEKGKCITNIASPDELVPISRPHVVRLRSLEEGVIRTIFSASSSRANDPLAIISSADDGIDDYAAIDVRMLPAFRVAPNLISMDLTYASESRILPHCTEVSQAHEISGGNYLRFTTGSGGTGRLGIYAIGSCDLNILFGCKPLIQNRFNGAIAMMRDGTVADGASDILLQSLQNLPDEWLDALVGKFRFHADFLKPRLFNPTFRIPGTGEEFPKTVIVLSVAADLTRTLYRHRELGFLVDPGGGWLNEPVSNFLADLSAASWFRRTFEKLEKISPERFFDNYTRIIKTLRQTVPHILIFNQLSVEPDGLMHSYQFMAHAQAIRRLEINLALMELSRQFDVSIIDVDRLLKRTGVRTQLDWNHPHPAVSALIANEIFRILCERGAFWCGSLKRATG